MKFWQRYIIQICKLNNEFATDIVNNMKNLESKLFKNTVSASGIFLDRSSINVILIERITEKVKHYLLQTYARTKNIKVSIQYGTKLYTRKYI